MFFQSKEVTECILSLYIPEKFQCFSGLWRQQEVFKIFQSQETARSFNIFLSQEATRSFNFFQSPEVTGSFNVFPVSGGNRNCIGGRAILKK